MGLRHQPDGFGYRTPVTDAMQSASEHVTQNEQNYDALKSNQQDLNNAIEGLYKDFNSFDVLSEGTDQAKKEQMMRQIAGKQIAYDILVPLRERMNSAIAVIDMKYKR